MDHFVPVSVAFVLQDLTDFTGRFLLPACQECNNLAGSTVFGTVAAKRTYIQTRLKDRYHSIYYMPNWSEEELDEMGRGLDGYIRTSQLYREWIHRRINWRNKDNPAYARIVGIRFYDKGPGKFSVARLAGSSTITKNIEQPLKTIEDKEKLLLG